jgi:very-short-patch-repair endonuclease
MRGEVLVAIVNNQRDFAIIQDQHWYRIPVARVKRFLKNNFPPRWIAFYQTKVFGEEAFAVRYYAQVQKIEKVFRHELLPNEPDHMRAAWRYYQIHLGQLQELEVPIISRLWRRIVFIPTTWIKFKMAQEINDLYDESPLEERLWVVFKHHHITAERQLYYSTNGEKYFLDFAIPCSKGDIAVETDGDTYHANPEKSIQDNIRNNTLEANGWTIFRFTTQQIMEQAETYCVLRVSKAINKLGGIDEGKYVARKINLGADGALQMGLFDEGEEE